MKKCPICSKDTVEAFKPFCSGRCADVDLHRWLGEAYRVPASENEAAEGLEAEDDTVPGKPH